MADKRMFHKDIIESDAFMDMPTDAQMLYIHLNLAADDLGFVGSPRAVMRSCGASNDSMKLLMAKKFVLTFENGDNFLVLIKHWKLHNAIRADRVKESQYKELLREVYYDENKAYSMNPNDGHVPCLEVGCQVGNQVSTSWQPTDNQVSTKTTVFDNQTTTNCQPSGNQVSTKCPHSIDKYSIDKISVDKSSIEEGGMGGETEPPPPPPLPDNQGCNDSFTHEQKSSIDFEGLIRIALKLGRREKANDYYAMAKERGIHIDVEAIKRELEDGTLG